MANRERMLADTYGAVKRAAAPTLGLEHLAAIGPAHELNDLHHFSAMAIRRSADFFRGPVPTDWRFDGKLLTFTSPAATGMVRNDRVFARFYQGARDRAVVLLPHWNASWASYAPLARGLSRLGISCLLLSLPFHDERQTPGTGFACELVNENLGGTIAANRQAVLDVRACLTWLEANGYVRLGLIGSSLGSSIATLAAAHDNRVRALVAWLMADDFTGVVWSGSASRHIRASLETRFAFADVQAAWSVISPRTYAPKLAERLNMMLIISGREDQVFLPEQTQAWVDRIRALGMQPNWLRLGCGHYTLGMRPYNYVAFIRTVAALYARL